VGTAGVVVELVQETYLRIALFSDPRLFQRFELPESLAG